MQRSKLACVPSDKFHRFEIHRLPPVRNTSSTLALERRTIRRGSTWQSWAARSRALDEFHIPRSASEPHRARHRHNDRRPAARTPSDFDEVFEHLGAIKQDLIALGHATKTLAKAKASNQIGRIGDLAEVAADKAAAYRAEVTDKIKTHPFAAVGVGVLSGLVLAAVLRRS